MCEMKLKDKVALVTGSAQGIGKSIALTLAGQGADIVVVDVNLEQAEKTGREIESLGVNVLVQRCDISQFKEVEELVQKILDKFSRVDILVNNAGITRDTLILRMKEEDWDNVLAINLKGAFNCLKAVSRPMVKQRSGKIVNVSSVIGLIGNLGQANYSASKAGLLGLTKSAARELARAGINVNAIAPGFISTAMTDRLPEQVKTQMLNQIPLNRFGQAEDVARLILFLVSEDSAYITGQVIKIDGGLVM